jgi:hypothetical protein
MFKWNTVWICFFIVFIFFSIPFISAASTSHPHTLLFVGGGTAPFPRSACATRSGLFKCRSELGEGSLR